jgi:hypothetical protein
MTRRNTAIPNESMWNMRWPVHSFCGGIVVLRLDFAGKSFIPAPAHCA